MPSLFRSAAYACCLTSLLTLACNTPGDVNGLVTLELALTSEQDLVPGVRLIRVVATPAGGQAIEYLHTAPGDIQGPVVARFEVPGIGKTYRFQRLVLLPPADDGPAKPGMLTVYHAPAWAGKGLWGLVFLAAAVLFWFLGRHLWQALSGKSKMFLARMNLALVPGFVAVLVLIGLVPLTDYPLWWGLWAAVLAWAGRQVFMRGWPIRPFFAWRRGRREKSA